MSLAEAGHTQVSATATVTSSCASCRRRKVRCSRTIPCSNCAKANYHCDYSLSGRRGRPKSDVKTPRYDKTAQARLLEKVQRLEEIVEDLNGQVDAANQDSATFINSTPSVDLQQPKEPKRLDEWRHRDPGSTRSTIDIEKSERDVNYEEPGLLVSSNNGKLYVGGDFWTTLRKEIRQVRESFEHEQEGEGNAAESGGSVEDTTDSSTTHLSPNNGTAFIFHEANAFDRTLTDTMFPLPSQMLFIWHTFVENIDPLVKVLHIPSMTRILEGCRGQLRTLDPDMLSLFACVSFAAIQSMSHEDVLLNFGTDKKSLSSGYRRGAEQSLSNADVINTTNLVPVQALTIYLAVLQSDEPFRHVWTLVGVLVRIAFSLGLHRDGKSFKNISPFDVELRRRLWWNVSMLDARLGESQVPIAIIGENMFTTEQPSNVNDADIFPGMQEPVVPRRAGSTDMSIHLARCKLWYFGRAIQRLSLEIPNGAANDDDEHKTVYQRKLEAVEKFKRDIKEYVSSLTEHSGVVTFVNATANLVADRIELMAHYQFGLAGKQGPSFPREAFQVALGILERYHSIENNPDMAKWCWALRGSVQWHAIGIILSHLCDVPWDEASERAWQLIDSSFNNTVKAVTKEPLWKPFQRLFSRTQRCRRKFLQTQKTDGNDSRAAGNTAQWAKLVSRNISHHTQRLTHSTPGEMRRTAVGDNSTGTFYGSEQGSNNTPLFPTSHTPLSHSYQAVNEDTSAGVISQSSRTSEFGTGIDASDIAPMDPNDWQQWNDCLQQGFWGFGGGI